MGGSLRRLSLLPLPLLAVAIAPSLARAHAITVDAAVGDWVMVPPTNLNTGHIGRNASAQGEYVWNDPTGDERTDFSAPDGRVDIDTFAVTSDATSLYFLVRMANIDITSGDGAPQVQIAIDVDRIPF